MTLQCVIIRTDPDNSTFIETTVWSRNGMPVQVNNGSGIFFLSNHALVFNSTTGGFTDLVITDVTLDDNNTMYSCASSASIISSSVVLNVIRKLYILYCVHVYIKTHGSE